MNKIICKRIYEMPTEADGFRVLVDRLWSRGIKKEYAAVDLWAKEIAPTIELRKWFGHSAERFEEFSFLYRAELDSNPYAAEFLIIINEKLKEDNITLLFAAKDKTCNHAIVLQKWIKERMSV